MKMSMIHKHIILFCTILMLSACHLEGQAIDSHYSIKADPSIHNIEEIAELLRDSLEAESELNISRFNVWNAYDGTGNLTHWIAYSECYEASLFSIPRRLKDDYHYTLSFYYKDCGDLEIMSDENLFIKLISDVDGIIIEKEF